MNEDLSPMQTMLYQLPFSILIFILVIALTEDNFEIQGLFDVTRPPNEWVRVVFIHSFIH